MKKEDIEFLSKLSETMRTQDHDCQAAPRFWVVAQVTKEYVEDEYGSYTDLVTEDGDTVVECANIKNVVEYFMEEYKDDVNEIGITVNYTPSYCEVFIYSEDEDYDSSIPDDTLFDLDDVISFFEDHDIIANGYYRTASYNINESTICPDTMFITKSSCKRHIELNHYHYNHPHTYAMTAWRSPEVERLWKILEETDWETAIRKESMEYNMEYKSIEEQKQAARNTNELSDYLRRIIEQNDERFSFEWLVGGERATMEIFDKEKKIGYAVKIEPIEYDENGEAVNL